jgi:diacylglycerol kinase (ATP)
MKPSRVAVVINPISGRTGSHPGEGDRRRELIITTSAALGIAVDVHMTTGRGHATALARAARAAGAEIVVAMGGDGTVNEVAQGLVGSDVALGIVPCGSGDGLARGLGLPRARRAAFDVALTGATSRMDVGYANDHLFLNVAGVGFDAAVGQLFATRKTRGALGYVVKSASLVWTYSAPHYEVTCDDERRVGRKFLIAFANAPEYGNGAVLAPDADVQDGVLDVVIVDAGSALSQIWRARRLFWNRRAPARSMERLQTRTARITSDHIVYHVDGEVFEAARALDIRVERQALAIRHTRAGR